jgi:integrase
LPAPPASVAVYLAALADGTTGSRARKPAGLEVALSAISEAHRAAKLRSPRMDPEVRAVRSGIRRTLGTAQRQAAALLVPELRRALALLPSTAHGARDRALLLTGWAGAFRRSALVALDLDDLDFTPEGVAITIRRDKTDQEAKGRTIGVPFAAAADLCPVRALSAWIDAARIVENGPVFRPIGQVLARRLSDRAVALIVQRAIRSIGGEPKDFSGHSLRAGFITAAARAGRSAHDITRQTGQMPGTVNRYIRDAEVWTANALVGLL